MSGWWVRSTASMVLAVLACGLASVQGRSQSPGTRRLVTIDDLMALSTINDVEIAPAGDRIAYTVSTPSLTSNTHETRVFVVASAGGDAMRLAEDVKVFVPALPAPRLRWSPDGTRVTFLGLADARPQVFAVAASGGPARALTHAAEGVTSYEWAPDGTRLAFLSRDGAAAPAVATPAGSQPPRTRLWVQSVDGGAPPQALSPPDRYVDSLSWSPDGREIAYASAPTSGFLAPYATRIDAVTVASGATRAVVARPGMNVQPQFSPDGRHLAFVTTNGGTGIIAPRGLAITPASGGDPAAIRAFPMNGAWMADVVWAADGQSLLVTMNEGTFATGAQMFEMPVVRVSLATGQAERVHTRPTVDYNLSLSRDGRTLAYRAVDARSMGELTVVDLPSGAHRALTAMNPSLNELRLGRLEPVSWRSFDGMEIWGLLLTPPGYDGGRRLPLVVYCHGGPIGGVTLGLFPQFMHVPGQIDPYPTEAFAAPATRCCSQCRVAARATAKRDTA